MATITRVPAVVDALVDLARTAFAGFDVPVAVLDGLSVGELPAQVIAFGVSVDSPTGYSSTLTRQQGLGRPRLVEEWSVTAVASVAFASDDMAAPRTALAGLLSALDDALRDEHIKPDVWDRAALSGTVEWMPMRAKGGATCSAQFTVVGASFL